MPEARTLTVSPAVATLDLAMAADSATCSLVLFEFGLPFDLEDATAATDHWSSFELLATASPEVTCTEKGESGKASRAAPSISRQTCRSVDPACVAMYETLYSPGTVSDHSPL